MLAPIGEPRPADGGAPGRRAVIHWAARLFVGEWRQQLLVFLLVVVAVSATFLGSAVATDTPPPASAGFGTAQDMATFSASGPRTAAQIAEIRNRFGQVQLIENRTVSIPGSVLTFQLRSQNPRGPYGAQMLQLLSGHYPTTPAEIAVTPAIAADFNLRLGEHWTVDRVTRSVVGTVENPQSLLDVFALVIPGQVTHPTRMTVLFDAHGRPATTIGANVTTPAMVASSNSLNPETLSLAVLTIGMLLIALVAIVGFTVLAQRRLRSLGMLASVGATERHVRLVVRANGAIVGIAGAIVGTVAGFIAWLAYRPHLEQSAHHVIGTFQLPWTVIGAAIVLATLATYVAASRPARTVAKVPVVQALSGRPPEPQEIHRSMVPGLVTLGLAFLILGFSGASQSNGKGSSLELVTGLVLLIPSLILLAPFCLTCLTRLGRSSTIGPRLALRDLNRYRARSGSALAAISIGVMIAVIVATAAASRYANVLAYVGPNMTSKQLIVYATTNNIGTSASQPSNPPELLAAETHDAHRIAASIGATTVVSLIQPNLTIDHSGPGRQWSGPLYIGSPQLLHAFGISPTTISPTADILSARPGLSGVSGLALAYCGRYGMGTVTGISPDKPSKQVRSLVCKDQLAVNHPVIQEISQLPSGTSAPNTVVTEHAVRVLHLEANSFTNGWLLEGAAAFSGAQIQSARSQAASDGLTIESKNELPTSTQIGDTATIFGIVLALCILTMSVGLIRSETASDLRTLVANGAGPRTRRSLTAVTAGALGLLGAVLGTFTGYVAVIGWLRDNSFNGGIASLATVPARNLLVILVGMPLIATAIGWLLAWRQPRALARQSID